MFKGGLMKPAVYKVMTAMLAAVCSLSFALGTAQLSPDHTRPEENKISTMDIIEIVSASPDFSTLAKALSSTDLFTVLTGSGPFTVFAPNDEAFRKLPPQTIQNLFKPENQDKLAGILTYHVVPGKLSSADLKNMDIKTVNGKTITIQVVGDQVMINNAKVIKKDMIGSNGVVYTIDNVLIP